MTMIDWAALAKPFPVNEIEWRIAQAGKQANGNLWAKVLAYLTNRAIMHRLDDVVGPPNWQNQFCAGPQGGVICGLSIRIDGEWVTKWDGAENTDIESVKGGLSDSMKRAAVQWGIGRYLYDLEEGWAVITDQKVNGSRYANCKIKVKGAEEYVNFYWTPPMLPPAFLPETISKPQETPKEKPNNGKSSAKSMSNITPEHLAFLEFVKPLVAAGTLKAEYVKDVVAQNNSDYVKALAEIEGNLKLVEGTAK